MATDWSSYGTDGRPGAASGQDFGRKVQLVSSNIQKLSQNVSSIERMVQQLGTPQDSEQLRTKLHEMVQYTNVLAKDTNVVVKDMNSMPPPSNPADQRASKVQKDRLMNDFSVVLKNFQTAQRVAAQKEKDSVTRARANSGIQGSLFEDDRATSAPSQTRLQIEQNVDLAALREREEAVKQLESDILDVNQIFKDLAVMVHEQGEMIDSIEANVEQAQIHVEQGHSNVVKAHASQRSARKKKVICLILVIIAIIVLALVIYFSVKGNN